MSKKFKITAHQKQIIIGKILGDGYLETTNGITYRLKVEHNIKQKEYVFWAYRELKNISPSKPKLKIHKSFNRKTYKKYWFNTSYTTSLKFYGQQFYPEGKKVVPKLIHRWLTPLAFAVWFMDDGSIKSKECKGKIINTQSFDEVSLKRLRLAIESNFKIKTTLRKQKDGTQLYIPASEYDKLKQVIGKYTLPSLSYKLG
jgi:recombination protein RecA